MKGKTPEQLSEERVCCEDFFPPWARLQVAEKVAGHSSYLPSGDNSLKA